jgi:hypothetical protein
MAVNTSSPNSSSLPSYWNVFAGVLQELLQARTPSLRMGHLDNREDPLTGKVIPPFKVARLQRSLTTPIFPTLNPDEIDRAARTFNFNWQEKVRLHAAVLATAVQALLVGRIGVRDAWLAGWQVLPIIEQYLLTHWDDEGLGSGRKGLQLQQESTPVSDDPDPFTAQFGVAVAEVERGWLALTLAEYTTGQRDRQAQAKTARLAFETAMVLLRPTTRAGALDPEAGRFWQEEAREGLNAAKQLLQGK